MTQPLSDRSLWKRISKTGVTVILGAVLAAGCSTASSGSASSVKVEPAAKVKIEDTIQQDADVLASTQVNVLTKVGGDIKEVLKKRGDTVQQGDVIFRLDSVDTERNKEKTELNIRNLQAQIDKNGDDLTTNKAVTRNTISKLQVQISDLEKAYNNARNDYDSGIASKQQVEKTENSLTTARLDLDTARKQLSNMENTDALASLRIQLESANVSLRDIDKTLSDYEVKAPITGVLTDLNPEVGMSVPTGYAAGTIQQLNPVKIHADLTESAAKLMRGSNEVTFALPDGGESMKASITYLADVMSPQSKTYVMEMSAPNPEQKLKTGMRVKLTLGGKGQQDIVVVPDSSIVKEGNDNYVFVVAGNQAEKRQVTLGRTKDTFREVVNGVKEGEQVVVSGQLELKDKDPVTVR